MNEKLNDIEDTAKEILLTVHFLKKHMVYGVSLQPSAKHLLELGVLMKSQCQDVRQMIGGLELLDKSRYDSVIEDGKAI